MFSIDSSLRSVPRDAGQVIDIIVGLNEVSVAIPDMPTEPCRAAVVGMHVPGGAFTTYIALFLTSSQRRVIYIPDGGPRPAESYQDLFDEAGAFLESMGFMLDDTRFRALSTDRQAALMKELPAFQGDEETREEEVVEELTHGVTVVEPLELAEELEVIESMEVLPPPARSRVVEPRDSNLRRLGRLLASF